jgi:acetyl esterase/lipase
MQTFSRREFGLGALALAVGSASTLQSAIAAPASEVDPLSLVDPDLRAELLKLQPEMEKETYTASTLTQMRKLAEDWAEAPSASPHFTMRNIPGSAGQPAVNVYVINQNEARARPAILHIHGGGYILGRATDGIKRLQAIATEHDCLVVTVDYRLAPEAKFPASLEDNYAALRWLYRQADELGVDRRRIAVMGESAGGGHAAALAIAARDRGEIPLCLQLLIYPMLDDRTGSTRQPKPWIGTYFWKRPSNVFGWSSLLGVPAGSAQIPYGAVPARVENLAGLPPAFIGVGSIDLFVEEDMEYARRLIDFGVSTELYVVAGAYHGFNEIVPAAPASVQFEKVLGAAIARGFKAG